jgi:hypothetical protein
LKNQLALRAQGSSRKGESPRRTGIEGGDSPQEEAISRIKKNPDGIDRQG